MATRARCPVPCGAYLQLLALVVELFSVVLQLPDLAVQLADHRVPLLLQLAVAGLLLLQTNLPYLDVFLLQLQLVFLADMKQGIISGAFQRRPDSPSYRAWPQLHGCQFHISKWTLSRLKNFSQGPSRFRRVRKPTATECPPRAGPSAHAIVPLALQTGRRAPGGPVIPLSCRARPSLPTSLRLRSCATGRGPPSGFRRAGCTFGEMK